MSSELLLYKNKEGDIKIDVHLENEPVWLTQKAMAQLFEVDRSVITKHLGNAYETQELKRDSTSAKIEQVQIEGNRDVKREKSFTT